jgi:5'-nucleotidase
MKILLTNDDGITAEGLWALYSRLSQGHTVTVIAPDRERTAVSHGITLHQPLRAVPVAVNGAGGIAVSGTPADCVKLGILEILKEKPDLVVAGLNQGANVGVNIAYSGTVAAAKEAALGGIPAIAASMEGRGPYAYETAAAFIAELADMILGRGLAAGTFLNVNFPDLPPGRIAGVRFSRHGLQAFREVMERRIDPRNRPYYWQGADLQTFGEDPDVDGAALRRGYISITPIRCDMTDYAVLEDLKRWGLERPRSES